MGQHNPPHVLSPKELVSAYRHVKPVYDTVVHHSLSLGEVCAISHSKLAKDPITAAIHSARM